MELKIQLRIWQYRAISTIAAGRRQRKSCDKYDINSVKATDLDGRVSDPSFVGTQQFTRRTSLYFPTSWPRSRYAWRLF